jgi:Oxidoreductase family, NAD-binding Rossmann fold
VGNVVKNVGIVGMSEGNGHPFSFSAIINGYSDSGLAASGWEGIYNYVRRRDKSEFGIEGLTVTHAWTQDDEQTHKLCEACLIPHAVNRLEDLIGKVDAVIIARDDFENHFSMAMPFLKAGAYAFVDKPLSLDVEELRAFKPYLESGKLMSCSGMRYAKELDEPRAAISTYGKIKLIRGAILNSWEQYGVHLLYAIFGFVQSKPLSVTSLKSDHISLAVKMDDGSLLQLDALGQSAKTFRIDIWGTQGVSSHEITDNFSMFRRTLWHFSESMRTGTPAIRPQETIDTMRLLIAGKIAHTEAREVNLNDIQI